MDPMLPRWRYPGLGPSVEVPGAVLGEPCFTMIAEVAPGEGLGLVFLDVSRHFGPDEPDPKTWAGTLAPAAIEAIALQALRQLQADEPAAVGRVLAALADVAPVLPSPPVVGRSSPPAYALARLPSFAPPPGGWRHRRRDCFYSFRHAPARTFQEAIAAVPWDRLGDLPNLLDVTGPLGNMGTVALYARVEHYLMQADLHEHEARQKVGK